MNKRLKHFEILKQRFRHGIPMHVDMFRACAVLTQLSIKVTCNHWTLVEY